MTTNAAAALDRIDRIVAELRTDARDGTAEGEDMSVVREWANGLSRATRSLRAALAERDAQVARLSETWMDERETTWIPPTAYAYAMVCRARDSWQARAEAAERARDEVISAIVDNAGWVRDDGRTYLSIRVADGADLSCKAFRRDALAAFLAADGGGGTPAATGTVADIPDAELLGRAVRNVTKLTKRQPPWARVMDVFALGSTYSAQLCRRFGVDPDTGKRDDERQPS